MSWTILVLALGCVGGDGPSEKPHALRMAEQRCAELHTARVEYSVRQSIDRKEPPRTQFFTFRCAGADLITIDQGAEDGIVQRGPDGQAAGRRFNGPDHRLKKDGTIWRRQDRESWATVWDSSRAAIFDLLDLRRLGLNPADDYADVENVLRQHEMPAPRYAQAREGDLEVVSAQVDRGLFRWYIDPQKDWSVVRTQVFLDDNLIGETRYTHERLDGIWFPAQVEEYRLAAGDVEPSTVVRVLHAEFNRPEHPLELTPADIGLEVGMFVRSQRADMRGGYWDGSTCIPFEEYKERVQAGRLAPGPTVVRESARHRAEAERRRLAGIDDAGPSPVTAAAASRPVKPPFETRWERYTRQFIDIFGLDAEQQQKAWLVCEECQALGRAYVDGRATALEELTRQRAALVEEPPAQRAERGRLLDRREEELLAPLDDIFRERLKPRLFKLPTRAQLQAAGDRAAGEFKPPQ